MENLLKDFIQEAIEQFGHDVSVDDVLGLVTDRARELAQERTGSSSASYLSDEEVLEIVEDSPSLLAEKKKKGKKSK